LDGQVVDHGLDACDLRGVCCGQGAGGITADRAAEGGDAVLDCGLDGLVAEGTVAGDAALESGGQAGVISGSGGWGAFAGGEADNQGESCDGQEGARSGEAFGGVHWSPFPVANTFTANTVNHFTGIRCETPV